MLSQWDRDKTANTNILTNSNNNEDNNNNDSTSNSNSKSKNKNKPQSHTLAVTDLVFNKTGTILYSSSEDKQIFQWSVQTATVTG